MGCLQSRPQSQVLPIFEKKPNFQNGQKSRENRTNMDIILSFLAKPVDKNLSKANWLFLFCPVANKSENH